VWQPGRDVSVDEAMIGFEGNAKEATTIPNKPTPTGFKVWCAANQGFLLLWIWHILGEGNGPVGVYTPRDLGGTIRGKEGNKTQAACLELLERLPGKGYQVFVDNLFTFTKFFELLRARGYGATGTCRTNSGVLEELVKLKVSDKNDTIPWGTTYLMCTDNGLVAQIGWKDNAFALMMSTTMDGNDTVMKERKRPKKTSSKAKTARVPFGNLPKKVLLIPVVFDQYNFNMLQVNEFDHMATTNPGLRAVRRGGYQSIEHWLLRVVLINTYLLALHSNVESPRNVKFCSQQEFRIHIINALLHMA
jgi:hypothetical protein